MQIILIFYRTNATNTRTGRDADDLKTVNGRLDVSISLPFRAVSIGSSCGPSLAVEKPSERSRSRVQEIDSAHNDW